MGGGRGCPGLRGRGPGDPPPMVPRLGEGASDSTSWTPCSRGGKRMNPRPCAASVLRARPLRVAQIRAPDRSFVCAAAEGGSRGGAASSPALPFLLLFFFFHLEERSVFDAALFMFLLGNKRLCACVFSCWFFKEMGRRKKLPIPFLRSFPPPPRPADTPRPALFSVLFCYDPHSCL